MKIMATIKRVLHHISTGKRRGRLAFGSGTLSAIETAIATGEAAHGAEIQLIVEARLPLQALLDGVYARGRAADLFSHYRLWDTETNCGILVYINLADRKVEIIADRGVAKVLGKAEWRALCQVMTRGFAQGAYEASTLAALAQLNGLLHERFPRSGAAPNEVRNQTVLL